MPGIFVSRASGHYFLKAIATLPMGEILLYVRLFGSKVPRGLRSLCDRNSLIYHTLSSGSANEGLRR